MSNTCEWSTGNRVRVNGQELTIIGTRDSDGDYLVKCDAGGSRFVHESEIDLVASKPASRDDSHKPKLEAMLQFPRAMGMVTALMEAGAKKYGQDNWKLGGKPDSEYINAALRHMVCHVAGVVLDEESGQPHLAHAAWNMLACCELNLSHTDGSVSHQYTKTTS